MPLSETGAWTFEGYASLFGRPDLGNDIVLPGAFAGSLARRGASGVKLLWQHDPAEPIGVWDEIREDTRGLFVRGRLIPELARAREARALLKSGALDGLSIGFRTEKARTDPRRGVRELMAVDLWEISLVTFPLLPEARVSAAKGTAPDDLDALVRMIRRGALRLGSSFRP
ncbi:HK97 family phage prohead protease [Segnochrobactraceae bacterium EtOH-i3]